MQGLLALTLAVALVTAVAGQTTSQARGRDREDDDERGRGRGSSSRGDPLMEAFDGTFFWFHGIPGHYYNLISEPNVFQISTLLKEANNAVHVGSKTNGTYMQGVAFSQGGKEVVIETFAHSSARVTVKVGGEELQHTGDKEVTHVFQLQDGSNMTLVWSLYKPLLGTSVSISTDNVAITVSGVPPSLDANNFWQPSYLNMNATLKELPKHDLQGVIGDTFHASASTAGVIDDPLRPAPLSASQAVYPVYPDFAYEIPDYFSAPRYTIPSTVTQAVISARRAPSSTSTNALTTSPSILS